jgi:hypothetical protein
MKTWLVVISLAVAASPSTARAADGGFSLGLRVGYGIPMGDTVKDDTGASVPLSDGISGKVPLWLDAGWRFGPSIYLGAYFEYGPSFVKDCPPGSSCSASDVRLGANLLYHFMPSAPFDPWIGVGFGYEWLNVSQDGIGAGLSGWEFVNIQAGGDFAIGSGFALGPYVVFGLGQYGTATADIGGQSISASIPNANQSLHEWLQFGVKGTFNL